MATMGERLWEMGKSPSQHILLLAFGLLSLLTGAIAASLLVVVGASAALVMTASVTAAVGAFFVTLALFLGAYTVPGDTVAHTAWKIAQLIVAVIVLLLIA